MAGHSHWAGIKHKKGLADKKRGKLFAKLSRAIIVACQNGGGDPATNLTLRYAIDSAKKNSMPKDNIERAVKKGCGESSEDRFFELQYEGYGPGGVAVLCDILTQNRNRTAGEIRKIFEIHKGNLGGTGCVAWMFERKAMFLISTKHVAEESLLEIALDVGADDVKQAGDSYQVTCEPERFQDISQAFEKAQIPVDVAEITRLPLNTVDLSIDDGRLILKFMEALEEHEDVQFLTANFNIPDEVMEEV